MEEWKSIPNFPGYEVSNLGQISGPRGIRKLSPLSKGYLKVALFNKGGRTDIPVHILVNTVFNGPKPYDGAMTLHRDNVPNHNRWDNLYWGTHQDNMDDRTRSQIQTGQRGEDHHSAKLNWDKVREIRRLRKEGMTTVELAKRYNVHQAHISLIVNNKSWKEV